MRRVPLPRCVARRAATLPGQPPQPARRAAASSIRGHAPLIDAPDARRIDLHASLRDPFGALARARVQRAQGGAGVRGGRSVGIDGLPGRRRKLDVLADFTRALAWSAWRNGDPFGFIGCDDAVRDEWLVPPSRHSAAPGLDVGARGCAHSSRAGSAQRAAARRTASCARQRVAGVPAFRTSTCRSSRSRRCSARLAHHEVVPVVLWDRTEFAPPRDGLAWLVDPESRPAPAGLGAPGVARALGARAQHERDARAARAVFTGIGWRRC